MNGVKKLLSLKKFLYIPLLVLIFGFMPSAHALVTGEDVFITQATSGVDTGANCANAHSVAWFNTATNWGVGAGKISAGDTVYLCGTITSRLNVQASGSAGNIITITAAAGGATLDMQSTSNFVAFSFNAFQYITVDGLTGDARSGNTTYPFRVINFAPGASDSTPSFSFYANTGGEGHLAIRHVEITGSGGSSSLTNQDGGVYLQVATVGDVEFSYNWIHGVNVGTKLNGTGVACWSATGTTSYTDGCNIHHNLIQYLQHDGIRVGSNASLHDNDITGVDGSGHSDSLLCQSGNYCAIYNNYVYNSGDQNIYIDNLNNSSSGHLRIYNNVINSNPGFGVVIDAEGGASSVWDDVVIANNTFYTQSASAIRVVSRGQVTNLAMLNNIFGTTSDISYRSVELPANTTITGASSWDYNIYSTASANYPQVAVWGASQYRLVQLQALSPVRETHGVVGVPTYVNAGAADFHLASGDTIAKNTGTNLSSIYSFLSADKDGAQRPIGTSWDIGAYQFSSVTPTPTATPTPTPTPSSTPPSVSLISPTAGFTISGSVSLEATASSNTGVTGVQFLLDGIAFTNELTTSPYRITWDTATASDGSHTLTAIAHDATGNQTTSSGTVVTVSNATASTPVSTPTPETTPTPTTLDTTTPPTTPSPITRPLYRGTKGDDVKTLQTLLIHKGHLPPSNDTGFFGLLTRAAVQKYQCAQNIVCSGTESSTGYGVVGPKTLARLSGGTFTTPSSSSSNLTPAQADAIISILQSFNADASVIASVRRVLGR